MYLVVNTGCKPTPNERTHYPMAFPASCEYLGIVVSTHDKLERAVAAQRKLYREALYPPFQFSIYELPWCERGYLPTHFLGPNDPQLVREGELIQEGK